MKCRRVIIRFIAVSFVCSTAGIMYCQKGTTNINPGPADVVTITDINKFITATDVAAGIQKTNNYVDPVRMSHSVHEESGILCVICHHKHSNDDRIKQCAYCHKGKEGDVIMHNFCITCHVEKKKGPALCQDCHKPVSVR